MKIFLAFSISILFFISCKKPKVTTDNPVPPVADTPKVPKLITNEIIGLTIYSGTFGGKIIDTGDSKIIEQGLVFDTVPMPTTNRHTDKFPLAKDSSGAFSTTIINILSNITFYVRAYAINSQGVGYGKQIQFTSPYDKIYDSIITLSTQQQVIDFGKNNYTTIQGLTITGTVSDLTPLHSLEKIEGEFIVSGTSDLKDFTGLENLQVIGAFFPNGFMVTGNTALTSFQGLEKLFFMHGGLTISYNPALVSLDGLNSLTTVALGDVSIGYCQNLTSLSGLNKLQNINGTLLLTNNTLLTDLTALGQVNHIGGNVTIVSQQSLQNLDGLEKVTQLHAVELNYNPLLSSISGLKNLDSITENINLSFDPLLKDVTAFSHIFGLQTLNIQQMDGFTNLAGFSNLQSVLGAIIITSNPNLATLEGLNNLTTAKSINISFNNSLASIKALGKLTSVISSPGNLVISSNASLTTLEGLEKLNRVDGEVYLEFNTTLNMFCPLKTLFTNNYSGYYYSSGNAVNPTQSEIISTCP